MKKTNSIARIISIVLVLVTVLSTFTIAASAASYSTGTYAVAANSGINVRSGAGTGYSIVGAASKGITFSVSRVSGSWGYTSSIKCTNGNRSGWVSLDYCTKKSTTNTTSSSTQSSTNSSTGTYKVNANSGINVRTGAGTGYSVAGAATKGTTFNVSKISGGWGYTSSIKCTNGYRSGWVSLSYCTKQGSVTASTPKPNSSNTSNASSGSKSGNTYTTKTVTENDVIYKYVTVTVDTSSMENWVTSVKQAESSVCDSEKGVIVAAKVKSTKTVSWKVPKAAVYQGPGITGYVTRKYTVPSVIQYKVHEHTRNMGYGKNFYFYGGNVVVVYTCNCGYRKELMEWTIPLPDTSDAQTTQKVIQGLPQIN